MVSDNTRRSRMEEEEYGKEGIFGDGAEKSSVIERPWVRLVEQPPHLTKNIISSTTVWPTAHPLIKVGIVSSQKLLLKKVLDKKSRTRDSDFQNVDPAIVKLVSLNVSDFFV